MDTGGLTNICRFGAMLPYNSLIEYLIFIIFLINILSNLDSNNKKLRSMILFSQNA